MKLHLAISNQSRAAVDADVVVKIDGRVVCAARLAAGAQHGWDESVHDLAPGRHSLEAEESESGAKAAHDFEADTDRWAVVMFDAPPPRFTMQVLDREVGFV